MSWCTQLPCESEPIHLLRLSRYLKPYSGMLLFAISLLFVQAMCDLSLPDYMSEIVNTGVIDGNLPFIWKTGSQMLVITLIGATASISMGYFAAMIAASVARNLRSDVFSKVLHFSNLEFDRFTTASLITRTTNDIVQIQTLLVLVIRLVFYAPIMGVGGIIKAIDNSTSMTWIIVLAVICLVGVIAVLFSIAIPKFQMNQKLVDRLNQVTRESLDGILVIRAFNTQKFELQRFDKANTDLTELNLFIGRVMSVMMPFMMLVLNMTTLTIVWVGAKQVSSFNLDIGKMIAYMQYALQIIFSFLMLSMMFIFVPRAAVSANRIADVLEAKEQILDPVKPLELGDSFTPRVEFRNVSFHYPGAEKDVLHDINFVAQPGQTVAIIGATGTGKSTLVNLIMRFYDVTGGQILVDGKDIRDIRRRDLRDRIGYVPQKSVLFSGTILSNFRYSDNDAPMDSVEKAAAIAQATEFIDSKDERYETPIAQGGTNVSGGQKQRLSIGRALVKNAPIYILDDSFSALDFKTDRRLREALKRETAGSTIFLVAQRVSTIMEAEQIIVLDQETIAGIGTHKELLKSCEVYRQIATSQLSEEELSR